MWICMVVAVFGLLAEVDSKVLLISMDGFRWDYIEQVNTPNFDEFARLGTKAPYVNGTFVTKTFPSHYTIATGLYEESHGIVGNQMYDPIRNSTFSMRSTESFWWDGGEPLWVTVQHHGLKSATFYWPGSDTVIRNLRPNIYRKYDESVPFEDRINTVISWLTNTTDPIDLAMLYFHEPDATGHRFGPSSDQVKEKVSYMDTVLGDIMYKMDANKLWDSVNVIVTSDHGMADVDESKRGIDLSQYIDINEIDQMPTSGPTANILPRPGKEDEMFMNLSNVLHTKLFKKQDIPDHWHYRDNDRILPLLLVADEGWLIGKNLSAKTETSKGAHGFDNRLSSMKPIFYARGPKIRQGYVSDPFNAVDIYPLVCELLGIKGADVNGTIENTKDFILAQTSSSTMMSSSLDVNEASDSTSGVITTTPSGSMMMSSRLDVNGSTDSTPGVITTKPSGSAMMSSSLDVNAATHSTSGVITTTPSGSTKTVSSIWTHMIMFTVVFEGVLSKFYI